MSPNNLLFHEWDLRDYLKDRAQEIFEEIDSIDGEELLETSVEDLCDYFEQKYKLEPPKLIERGINVDKREVQVDVSGDIRRVIRDRGRPHLVRGTEITYFIPFEGDAVLFRCTPSVRGPTRPRAVIRRNEILVNYTLTDHDEVAIKSEFDRCLGAIREYLETIERDVSTFNASIREKANGRIEARRKKLLADQNLVESLGFPLRRREGAPPTYKVPIVRKKISLKRPSGDTTPSVREYWLDMKDYEDILSIMFNMTRVMELSPKAVRELDEEDLRVHFLVQLNGQYEGQATGETFNFEGKTDILIRVKNKNIFIAECKFWNGPEYLSNAVDQLLNYTSWRDTKTAIVVLNRGGIKFSTVLKKIPEVIKSHSNFKQQLDFNSETGFRFVLHHRDDVNRELLLTVLAFEVPK